MTSHLDDLTPFQQRAAAAAVVNLLTSKNFYISDLDAIAKTLGRDAHLAGPDYHALRGLHCMAWIAMGPDLARMTREKCLEILGLPPRVIDVSPATGTRAEAGAGDDPPASANPIMKMLGRIGRFTA